MKHDLKVTRARSSGKIESFLTISNSLNRKNASVDIVSHSLRGTVITRLLKLTQKNIRRNIVFLHQMPSFASKRQQILRLIYSQFADSIFIFSEQARIDWHRKYRPFARFLKKPLVLRNGVYIERLKQPRKSPAFRRDEEVRLIFLGRLVNWKGAKQVIKLLSFSEAANWKLLLITPELDHRFKRKLMKQYGSRVSFITGKTIESYRPLPGDVHIYLTDYGKKVNQIGRSHV